MKTRINLRIWKRRALTQGPPYLLLATIKIQGDSVSTLLVNYSNYDPALSPHAHTTPPPATSPRPHTLLTPPSPPPSSHTTDPHTHAPPPCQQETLNTIHKLRALKPKAEYNIS